MPRTLDVATQVPHNPVRAYVMGEDAGSERMSTPEERARMAEIVAEGLAAGALGFTTSRTKFHRTSTGDHGFLTDCHGSCLIAPAVRRFL